MQKEQLIDQLTALQLSKSEATTYLALLNTGPTTAGEIIRRTGLHRAVVYASFDKLIDRNLVMKFEKRKIAHFQALSPERLTEYAKSLLASAEAIVPSLSNLVAQNPTEITVHEGLEAYRNFWLDVQERMPAGSTQYVAGSIGDRWFQLMEPVAARYTKRRMQRRIKWKMIVYQKDEIDMSLLKKYPKMHEYRLINRPSMVRRGNFNICGNQSVVLHDATIPILVEVRNEALVAVFKDLFDLLWDFGESPAINPNNTHN